MGNAIIVDTNVLIHDPNSIYTLMDDDNVVMIHTSVLMELDKLKTKFDIGKECRDSIKIIEKLQLNNDKRFSIVNSIPLEYIFDTKLPYLDRKKTDHEIIAYSYYLSVKGNYKKVKLISNDASVRVLARELGIITEEYTINDNSFDFGQDIPYFNVHPEIINQEDMTIDVRDLHNSDDISENTGIVCGSSWNWDMGNIAANSKWEDSFVAIKKGNKFKIIDKNINLMGITPYSEEFKNWEQYIAMEQLLDRNISLCFIIGSSGSGKSLLALAAAIQQRKYYRNILVSRPMITLGDEDNMGYLPGSVEEKMNPWIKPIFRLLNYIANVNSKNEKIISKLRDGEKKKLDIEPIDYIRGNTFYRDIIIIDEAQNLTPLQIKSIITRCGKDTKIIFTGDLNQIDRRGLTKKSSGLAYAISKMSGHKLVSTICFKNTIRSEIVKLAENVL